MSDPVAEYMVLAFDPDMGYDAVLDLWWDLTLTERDEAVERCHNYESLRESLLEAYRP